MSKAFILKHFDPSAFVTPLNRSETRPLQWAHGATLAEDVIALVDIPPYDMATRDGWAVNSTNGVNRIIDTDRIVNGTVPMPLPSGHARWINTGGMIPLGCDAIIPANDPSDIAQAKIESNTGQFILHRGEERRHGEVILPRGTRLGVRECALLSEACVDEVKLRVTPRILIVSTGSEISTAGKNPIACRRNSNAVYFALLSEACVDEVKLRVTPRILIVSTGSEISTAGKNPIACRRNSNAVYLQTLFDVLGIEQSRIVRVADNIDAIATAISKYEGINFIVSIGGTGRGSHDLTRRAILAAGGTIDDKAPKDEKKAPPFIMAELDGIPIIGLPGNPLGSVMLTQRVLLPMLAQLYGLQLPHQEELLLPISETLTIESEGELCVAIEREGRKTFVRPVSKGRGNTRIFAIDAGTVHVAPDTLHAGDIVKVKRFFN